MKNPGRRRGHESVISRPPQSTASNPTVAEGLESRRLLSFATFGFPPAAINNQDAFPPAVTAAGPDGNLWIADAVGNRILKVTPQGSFTQYALPKGSEIVAIAGGPDGNVWFVDDIRNVVERITPAGKITSFPIPKVKGQAVLPTALADGADGNLWMLENVDSDTGGLVIGRITPAGTITQTPVPKAFGFGAAITAGPDGNVWFGADDGNNNPLLGRVTPAGTVKLFPFKIDISSMTSGPLGSLWVTGGSAFGGPEGPADGEIDRVDTNGKLVSSFRSGAPRGTNFFPEFLGELVAGSDGNLWFTTGGSEDQLGGMTPAGRFTEFAVPGGEPSGFATQPGTVPATLTAAPDGNLWYVPFDGGAVTRFDFHNAILASSAYVDTTAGPGVTAKYASFVDLGPAQPASAYKATIAFDDGSTALGIITSDGHGGFNVTAAHTLPLAQSAATITIEDAAHPSRNATAAALITAQPPTLTGIAANISAVAGQIFSGSVATVSGALLDSLDQYTPFIDWGDGQSSSGQLIADNKGGVSIVASHGYAAPGSYQTFINIELPFVPPRLFPTFPPDPNAPPPFPRPVFFSGKATISPGVMSGAGYTLLAQSHHPTTLAYATFTLAKPLADLSHYRARLEWGDLYTDPQRPMISLTILPRPGGTFIVAPAVTFAAQGIAYYRIVISDDRLGAGDASIVGLAYGQILVNYPASPPPKDEFGDQFIDLPIARVMGASGDDQDADSASFVDDYNPTLAERVDSFAKTLSASINQKYTGDVGTLGGVIPSGPKLQDLHGTIFWGDGATSAATFTRDAKGTVHVKGAHAYSSRGKYIITIVLSQTIYQGGLPEDGMPDLRLPTIISSMRVS